MNEALQRRRAQNLKSPRIEVRTIAPSIRSFAQAIDRQRASVERVPLLRGDRPGCDHLLRSLDDAEAAAVALWVEDPAAELPALCAVLPGLSIPALRADLLVEEFQVHESRAAGFDAVLLHAALLDEPLLRRLCEAARATHMAAAVACATAAEVRRAAAAGVAVIAPLAGADGVVPEALLAAVPRRTLILALPAAIASGGGVAPLAITLAGKADALLDPDLGAAADPAGELRRHLESQGDA